MAGNKNAMSSMGRSVALSNTRQIGIKFYASDNTKSEILTAGFFNASRADLAVGTIILVAADLDGTPALFFVRVTAVAAGADVTVSLMATATS